MKRRIGVTLIGSLAAGIGLVIAAAGAEKTAEAAGEDASPTTRFHADAEEIVAAACDTLGALLKDDGRQARLALDRVHAQLRSLEIEDREQFGGDIVRYSKPVLGTVNIARETASAGELERAFVEFVSIQKSCRICHDLAREQGLIAVKEDDQ